MQRRGFLARLAGAIGLGGLAGKVWADAPEIIESRPAPQQNGAYVCLWTMDFPAEVTEVGGRGMWGKGYELTLSSGEVYHLLPKGPPQYAYFYLPSRRLTLPWPATAYRMRLRTEGSSVGAEAPARKPWKYDQVLLAFRDMRDDISDYPRLNQECLRMTLWLLSVHEPTGDPEAPVCAGRGCNEWPCDWLQKWSQRTLKTSIEPGPWFPLGIRGAALVSTWEGHKWVDPKLWTKTQRRDEKGTNGR